MLGIVRTTGQAMRDLRQLAGEQPDRKDIQLALHHTRSVLEGRHMIAHSLALEDIETGGHAAIVMYNPRTGAEAEITAAQLCGQLRDLRIAYERAAAIIDGSGFTA